MQDEQAKTTSSIIKLFQPLERKLPLNTYSHFAVDANNLFGNMDNVLSLLWKSHRYKCPPQSFLHQLVHAVNNVVNQYFRQLKPLIYSKLREDVWIVFDGLKLKHITWPGGRKQTYHWPILADEAKCPQKELEKEQNKPDNFFYFLDIIRSAIKNNAEQIGMKVFVAPYEGDSQIVKMYQEGIIDCVISKDYEFVYFGVPMVLPQLEGEECIAIDFSKVKTEQLQDQLLAKWVKEADRHKRLMFSVLSGSKYMSHFRALTFRQIMQIVLDSSCLAEFFRTVTQRYQIPRIKNFRGTFEDTAHSLLLLYQFQICYSFKNKQQEPLNHLCFERFFRENKISSAGHNKQFNKTFRLIGDIIAKYDQDENYRNGKLKIHNDKKRAKTYPIQGETVQERINFLFSHQNWLSEATITQIFHNKGHDQ